MRKCKVCGTELTPASEGFDHIGFIPYSDDQEVFICRHCLNAIQWQVEYGLSRQDLEVVY
jgi:hypothetical protein